MDFLVYAYSSIGSQAVPVIAGYTRPSRQSSAKVWVMAWCATYFGSNMVALYLRSHHLYNHIVTYVTLPLEALEILWALSLWQRTHTARLTIRLVIPLAIASMLVLIFTVEDVNGFSVIAEPVYSLLALGAAIFTVLSRTAHEDAPLLRQDWLWVCAGLMIHFGALAVLTPVAEYTMTHNRLDLFYKAYKFRAVLNVGAYILITIGILCPPTFSGRSS